MLINPQINGRLVYVAKEGDDVRAGAPLVEIDCGPYKAALTQAQGALKRDQAIAGRRCSATWPASRQLVAQNSIARQTAEDQAATVKQDQGTVLADQGTVQAAQVNVGYCRINSPVEGRVGVRLVDPGNIVTTGLTTRHHQRQPDRADRRDFHGAAGRLPAPRRRSPAGSLARWSLRRSARRPAPTSAPAS